MISANGAAILRRGRTVCGPLVQACLFALWTIASFGLPRLALAEEARPAEDATLRADRLYRKGVEAYKARQYEEAWQAFKAAYETKPTVEVLRNLGAAEIRAGKLVDGARHLARWLRATGASAPLGVSTEDRQAVEALLHSAENQLSQLVIETSLEGAELKVDGEHVGRSPLGFRVHVDAGQHVIEARTGAVSATQTITATAGSVLEVKLEPKRIDRTPSVVPPQAGNVETGLSMPPLASRRASPRRIRPQALMTWDILFLASGGLGAVGTGLVIGAWLDNQDLATGTSSERLDVNLVEAGMVMMSTAALGLVTGVTAITIFNAPSSFTGVAGVSVEPHRAGLVMQGRF